MSAETEAVVYASHIADFSSKEMNENFGLKAKYANWLRAWQADIKSKYDMGFAPKEAYDQIASFVVTDEIVIEMQLEENKIHHDINAAKNVITNYCPLVAEHIHAGLTSMDVDDNDRVLRQRKGLEIILSKLNNLKEYKCETLNYLFDRLGDYFKPLNLRGKKPSGAIGHSQDLMNYFKENGPEPISDEQAMALASEYSKRFMNELDLPYFERCTQIYPRVQDKQLADYTVSIGREIKKHSDDPMISVRTRLQVTW